MTLSELYQIKVGAYRDFIDHLFNMVALYLGIVGAVLKFTFDKNATSRLAKALNDFLIIFTILAMPISAIYVRHGLMTTRNIEEVGRLLAAGGSVHVLQFPEDSLGMNFMAIAAAVMNVIVFVIAMLMRHAGFIEQNSTPAKPA